jgi:hypothetical protein
MKSVENSGGNDLQIICQVVPIQHVRRPCTGMMYMISTKGVFSILLAFRSRSTPNNAENTSL